MVSQFPGWLRTYSVAQADLKNCFPGTRFEIRLLCLLGAEVKGVLLHHPARASSFYPPASTSQVPEVTGLHHRA